MLTFSYPRAAAFGAAFLVTLATPAAAVYPDADAPQPVPHTSRPCTAFALSPPSDEEEADLALLGAEATAEIPLYVPRVPLVLPSFHYRLLRDSTGSYTLSAEEIDAIGRRAQSAYARAQDSGPPQKSALAQRTIPCDVHCTWRGNDLS